MNGVVHMRNGFKLSAFAVRALSCHKVLIILLAVSSVFCAYARQSAEYVPKGLSIGLGNDKWTMGLANNDDDHLSFSFNAVVSAPRYLVQISCNSLTNRGWKEDWPDADSAWHSGRFDSLRIIAGPVCTAGGTVIIPLVGLTIAGDLQLEDVQNLNHYLKKIPLVHLDYVKPLLVKSILGFEIEQKYNLGYVNAGLRVEARYIHDYEGVIEAAAFASVPHIELMCGWSAREALSSFLTQKLAYEYMKGFHFDLKLDNEILFFEYRCYPGERYAFGTIGASLMALQKKPTWQKNDLFFTFGYQRSIEANYFANKLEIPISNEFNLLFKQGYTSSYPKAEGVDPSKLRIQRNYSFWMLGASCFFDNESTFKPYVQLGLGYLNFNVVHLTNVDRTAASGRTDLGTSGSLLAELEVGVKILSNNAIRIGSSTVSFTAGATFGYAANRKSISSMLSQDRHHKDDFVFQPVECGIFAGVCFGLDAGYKSST